MALGFLVSGASRVEHRSTWLVESGDVLLVPAGQPHRALELRKPVFWGAQFDAPSFVANDDGEDAGTLLDPFERVRAGASAVVSIPSARHAYLESLFRELTEASTRSARPAVSRSLLTLILDEVGRAATWPHRAVPTSDVVSESLRVIERRCLGPLTLEEVAAAVNRSPSYVTTALRRATGRTAVAWIIAGRMAEARRRLLHSSEMIDVIAERVGYSDPTHFIRMFRREHGETPAAWRTKRARSA